MIQAIKRSMSDLTVTLSSGHSMPLVSWGLGTEWFNAQGDKSEHFFNVNVKEANSTWQLNSLNKQFEQHWTMDSLIWIMQKCIKMNTTQAQW